MLTLSYPRYTSLSIVHCVPTQLVDTAGRVWDRRDIINPNALSITIYGRNALDWLIKDVGVDAHE